MYSQQTEQDLQKLMDRMPPAVPLGMRRALAERVVGQGGGMALWGHSSPEDALICAAMEIMREEGWLGCF